jgi:hypothetical protein
VSPLQAGVLTYTHTLPPYAHPALTPYSGAGAKVWGEYTSEGKSETTRAEAFFKEATPWGTGVDYLGHKSCAGEKQVAQLRTQIEQVAQLRTQIADVKKVKEPKGKHTPKASRGGKRDRSSDDDEDLEALDESPDSAKRDRDSVATELATQLATQLAQVKADVANELAKVI